MEAGLADHVWEVEELIGGECRIKRDIDELIDELIQDCEIARKSARPF